MGNQAAYDTVVEGYRDAFSRWHGGKYLEYFKPAAFSDPTGVQFFMGVADEHLLIDEEIAGVETPAELYQLVDQMITRPQDLPLNFDEHFKAA
jgi:hypothetical protein